MPVDPWISALAQGGPAMVIVFLMWHHVTKREPAINRRFEQAQEAYRQDLRELRRENDDNIARLGALIEYQNRLILILITVIQRSGLTREQEAILGPPPPPVTGPLAVRG